MRRIGALPSIGASTVPKGALNLSTTPTPPLRHQIYCPICWWQMPCLAVPGILPGCLSCGGCPGRGPTPQPGGGGGGQAPGVLAMRDEMMGFTLKIARGAEIKGHFPCSLRCRPQLQWDVMQRPQSGPGGLGYRERRHSEFAVISRCLCARTPGRPAWGRAGGNSDNAEQLLAVAIMKQGASVRNHEAEAGNCGSWAHAVNFAEWN